MLAKFKANTPLRNLDCVQALGFVHASYPTFSPSNVTDVQHNIPDNYR